MGALLTLRSAVDFSVLAHPLSLSFPIPLFLRVGGDVDKLCECRHVSPFCDVNVNIGSMGYLPQSVVGRVGGPKSPSPSPSRGSLSRSHVQTLSRSY